MYQVLFHLLLPLLHLQFILVLVLGWKARRLVIQLMLVSRI